MYSIKKYFYASVLGTMFLTGCQRKEFSDLTFEFANVQQETVDLGSPLVLESSIENQSADCNKCETKTANASDRAIHLQYRPDENSPWVDAQLQDQNGTITYELVKPVPEIPAGGKHAKSEGFLFGTPGIYRYSLVADLTSIVEERDETNNDANAEDGMVRSVSNGDYRLIVIAIDPTHHIQPNYDPNITVVVKYLGGE